VICAKTLDGETGVNRRRLFKGMAAAIATAWLGFSALAASRDDIFAVSIPLDATAASANAARDAARLDGERRAYAALLARLTLARDKPRLPPATDSVLNDVIQGFEVANERRSSVRYLADYTFHFRPDAVEQMLRNAGIPFAETVSKPLVVLAVFDVPGRPMLWDDPNPWRDAWANTRLDPGLVPFTIPLGEVEDIAAIDAAAAEGGDHARLDAVAKNYAGADILVTRAAMKGAEGAHAVDVSSTRFMAGEAGGEPSWTGSYAANPGESDEDFLARVVVATANQIEEAWKQANLIDYGQSGTLLVSVPATDLSSWVTVRDRLSAIPSIQRLDLVALDRQRALVALHYYGAQDQLKIALLQRDLDLSGADPNWILRTKSVSAPRLAVPDAAAGAMPQAVTPAQTTIP